MNFIEALRLKSKLFFLFIIITVGLVIVGVMGAININAMKKNLDSLYFGSLVPVTELSTILQSYHGTLANTIYKARNAEITSNEAQMHISGAINSINKDWKAYENHYKLEDEILYVEYASSEIKKINRYFESILKAITDGSEIKDLNFVNFEIKIAHIHKVINRLIAYEIDMARYERKSFLETYDSTVIKVGIILLIVIFSVMMISYFVFKSIQNDQSALEIATKKLKVANRKLENASYLDSLTGLYNRRYFNIIYERELKRARRAESYITFMMLDIDYFKQYNDTYGHIDGDAALQSVAKILQSSLKRPGDFVFRLGGEEFGVLLTDTNEDSSILVAKSICDSLRESKIEHKASKVSSFVTISIGIACCRANEKLDNEKLITKADEMLYKVKESSRDGYEITTDIITDMQ